MPYEDFILDINSRGEIKTEFRGFRNNGNITLSDEQKKTFQDLKNKRLEAELEWIKQLGSDLTKGTFSNENLRNSFNMAMNEININRNTKIRICIKAEGEYINYPWELMYYENRFLALSLQTPIVRIHDGINQEVSLTGPIPKTLFILSYVNNHFAVDIVNEMKLIQEAAGIKYIEEWSPNRNPSDYSTENLKIYDATRDNILAALDANFNIIHFSGHGGFRNNDGFLALRTNESGELDEISSDDLHSLFQNTPSLGLIILNACSTASIPDKNDGVSRFEGIIPKLLTLVPAVIGMRQAITNNAAKKFAKYLYRNISNMSIEEAVTYARNGMKVNMQYNEFFVPILYLGWRNNSTVKSIFSRIINEVSPTTTVLTSLEKLEDDFSQINDNLVSVFLNFENHINTLDGMPQDMIFPNSWMSLYRELMLNCNSAIEKFSKFPKFTLSKKKSLDDKLALLYVSLESGNFNKIKKDFEDLKHEFNNILQSLRDISRGQ